MGRGASDDHRSIWPFPASQRRTGANVDPGGTGIPTTARQFVLIPLGAVMNAMVRLIEGNGSRDGGLFADPRGWMKYLNLERGIARGQSRSRSLDLISPQGARSPRR